MQLFWAACQRGIGIVLLLTSILKFEYVFLDPRVSKIPSLIPFVHLDVLLILAGDVEFILGLLFLVYPPRRWLSALLGAFALCVLIYRLCMVLTDWKEPCGCIGNLASLVGLSPSVESIALWILSGLFLMYSVVSILLFRTQPAYGQEVNDVQNA